MTPLPLEIHPRAIDEARRARQWYARRSRGVAHRFAVELDHAVQQITTMPQSWPPYLHGTRAYRLRRFPYFVVYLESSDRIQVHMRIHGNRLRQYPGRRLPCATAIMTEYSA
jgi:plasmid stabilization system protein ParE